MSSHPRRSFEVVASSLLLLLLLLPLLLGASAAAPLPYRVPSFDLQELRDVAAGGYGRREDLVRALGTSGLLAVALDGPSGGRLLQDRDAALEGLCGCAASSPGDGGRPLLSVPGTDGSTLADGRTARTTLATATVGRSPLPLPTAELEGACGGSASLASSMEGLRDAVAEGSAAFVAALDGLIRDGAARPAAPTRGALLRSTDGASYRTVSDIVGASKSLEHFHVYEREKEGRGGPGSASASASDSDSDSDSDSLGLHTDAGLFLAFVPAISCGNTHPSSTSANRDSAFYVLDPLDGKTKVAVFPQDRPSVIIMLGIGAERWLDVDSPGLGLRATRHKVRMDPGGRRAWYGTMHLVPDRAIVQSHPAVRTFADMRGAVALGAGPASSFRYGDGLGSEGGTTGVSIGCGAAPDLSPSPAGDLAGNLVAPSRRRLQHATDGRHCNNSTNFYCWMNCVDIPDGDNIAAHVERGESLYCLDEAVLDGTQRVAAAVGKCEDPYTGIPGGAMDPGCVGRWKLTVPGVPSQKLELALGVGEEKYCYGSTAMYMQGFEWQGTQCVAYLFQSWVLDRPWKFALAAVGTIVFGIVLEGTIYLRRIFLAKAAEAAAAGGGGSTWGSILMPAATYGIQLTLGYLIMLVVMTYSAPLFICVILGIVFGHAGFAFLRDRTQRDRTSSSQTSASGTGAGLAQPGQAVGFTMADGATPCCQNEIIEPCCCDPVDDEDPDGFGSGLSDSREVSATERSSSEEADNV